VKRQGKKNVHPPVTQACLPLQGGCSCYWELDSSGTQRQRYCSSPSQRMKEITQAGQRLSTCRITKLRAAESAVHLRKEADTQAQPHTRTLAFTLCSYTQRQQLICSHTRSHTRPVAGLLLSPAALRVAPVHAHCTCVTTPHPTPHTHKKPVRCCFQGRLSDPPKRRCQHHASKCRPHTQIKSPTRPSFSGTACSPVNLQHARLPHRTDAQQNRHSSAHTPKPTCVA
jgi:hypothetical protein